MTIFFYARDIPSCTDDYEYSYGRRLLNKDIIAWLSKNLRRRPGEKFRRYDYIRHQSLVWQRPRGHPPKRFTVGVKIYNEEDVIAFKLRWL